MPKCKSQSDIAARVNRNNPKSRLNWYTEVFIAANPDVWSLFCKLAKVDIGNGYKRLSAKLYFEIIRRTAPKRAGGKYKLENTMTPYFARRFMATYPKSRGMFVTRPVKG